MVVSPRDVFLGGLSVLIVVLFIVQASSELSRKWHGLKQHPAHAKGSGVIVGLGRVLEDSGGLAFDADRPDSRAIKKPMALATMGFALWLSVSAWQMPACLR
jgi:hypothetical protein